VGARGRIEARLARAEVLLEDARRLRAPRFEADADLAREAERLRPTLEALAGRPYGRLPRIAFRRGLEARLAGPWSQYVTLGLGFTRRVRMTSRPSSRLAIPAVLAHELAHRYAFDETLTTLRGLEASARHAADGDAAHAVAARLELARCLLGAAMGEALRAGEGPVVDAWLRARRGAPGLARATAHWARVARGARRADWALTVYQELPLAALERAAACCARESEPPPLPRFALDSAQAAFIWTTTHVDALTGRRRARVPLDASLALLREAARAAGSGAG
jgi:hypothetical protein